MHRLLSCTGFSALLLAFFVCSAEAQVPNTTWQPKTTPYEWRTEPHDATYTDLATKTMIDWDFVNGVAPSSRDLEWGRVGAASVQVRRNYVYIQDNDRLFNTPFSRMSDFSNAFEFATRELYSVVPQEHIFIYLFTSFETGVGAFFYQHQANEIRGIGLPMFDNNGASNPLQGFIFMNYWKSFEQLYGQAGPDVVQGFSRHTFNQEAGHRWVVSFDRDSGGNQRMRDLLGRDQAHWSYFMNSEASPMEGNWWRDNGNGTFTTRTNYNNWYFNSLDLYLMGMKAVSEVEPWWLITDVDASGAQDLRRRTPTADSPPQILFPQTVSGTKEEYDITEVTNQFGARYPPMGSAPTTFRAIFVMLANQNNSLNESQRVEFEEMVDQYVEGFRAGTGYVGNLDYGLMADTGLPIGAVCTDVSECNPAESNLCALPVVTNNKICTRRCASATGCPSDWCCQAGADGAAVCLPTGLCTMDPPDAGVTPTPDAGSSGGPDTGTPPVTQCVCDIDTSCTMGCECDLECYARTDCACDVTDICDPDCERCDPECLYGAEGCSGCTVAAGSTESETSGWFLLFGLVTGLALLRRRWNTIEA